MKASLGWVLVPTCLAVGCTSADRSSEGDEPTAAVRQHAVALSPNLHVRLVEGPGEDHVLCDARVRGLASAGASYGTTLQLTYPDASVVQRTGVVSAANPTATDNTDGQFKAELVEAPPGSGSFRLQASFWRPTVHRANGSHRCDVLIEEIDPGNVVTAVFAGDGEASSNIADVDPYLSATSHRQSGSNMICQTRLSAATLAETFEITIDTNVSGGFDSTYVSLDASTVLVGPLQTLNDGTVLVERGNPPWSASAQSIEIRYDFVGPVGLSECNIDILRSSTGLLVASEHSTMSPLNTCGDGSVGGAEECDDGNAVETDGCTSACDDAVVCDAVAFPGGDRFAVDVTTGRCYVSFDDETTTFSLAQNACAAAGGYLATIANSAEDQVVRSVQNLLQNPWIGASEDANDTDAVFAWVTGEAFGYTHFQPGQPDDDIFLGGFGECLHVVNASGEWNDTNCDFVGFVTGRICEIELEPCGDGVLQPGEQCDDGGTDPGDGCSAVCSLELLYFSEYVEGSGSNKALEISSAQSTAIDLSFCEIGVYINGSATPTVTLPLSGTLAQGDVHLICHSAVNAVLPSACDQVSDMAMVFNGDDAIALACQGNLIDVIGQIGFDPGPEWGAGLTSTADNTLRRKCGVISGDPIGNDTFVPSVQWDGFAMDTLSGLGNPCGP